MKGITMTIFAEIMNWAITAGDKFGIIGIGGGSDPVSAPEINAVAAVAAIAAAGVAAGLLRERFKR